MTAMALYAETIEGRHLLFDLARPGWYAEGASEDESLAAVPAALDAYAAWLQRHGEPVPALPDSWRIVERFTPYELPGGFEVNALFTHEREPPDHDLRNRAVRLLGYLEQDYAAVAQAIPPDRCEIPMAPGERPPREVLAHVARAGCWYLTHLTEVPAAVLSAHPQGSIAQVASVRTALVDWLLHATNDDLARIVVDREEAWSAAKLIRRALWHERTHLRELERLATAR